MSHLGKTRRSELCGEFKDWDGHLAGGFDFATHDGVDAIHGLGRKELFAGLDADPGGDVFDDDDLPVDLDGVGHELFFQTFGRL